VLIYKYLHSGGQDNVNSQQKGKVLSQDTREANNRPVAINDKAMTNANVPVNINILANDKDADGDKLSIMGLSLPRQGTVIPNSDGTITYSPLKSWAGTETFAYTISDGNGGIATASVAVIVQPTENHLPEAQDQDIAVNENRPVKIKLEAKDPDDNNLRFILVSKPFHGRIVQFSSSTGTLGYIPDENYDGKDSFTFKVNDGIADSKDAEVSINIKQNEKLGNDQVRENDQQPKKEESSQTPSNEKKSNDENSNSDTPPNDSNQQPPPPTEDNEQPKKDLKEEEQQSSQLDKPASDTDTAPSGDSQPTPDS